MIETSFTPTGNLLPEPLIDSLQVWVESQPDGSEVTGVSFAQHSNDVAELQLDDGRKLMVKRGRYDWVAGRFDNSRVASEMLRRRAGLSVPEPLDLPPEIDDRPLEVYWRIELPTLSQIWGELGPGARRAGLVSWGAMLRRLHDVPLPGWGSLRRRSQHPSLETYLGKDLYERLIPSVWGEWPGGVEPVETLAGHLPELAARIGDRSPVMVHGDLHMGNILCEPDEVGPSCVGLLDLETAVACVEESDLAIAEVLHGPLFEQPLPRGWLEHLLSGYGTRPDPFAMAFFRAYHLANLGFFSALVGDAEHAEWVLGALRAEVRGITAL